MKRRLIIIILGVLLIAFGTFLLISRYFPSTDTSEVKNLYGNTTNNLLNGGGVAKQENDIFFVVYEDGFNKIAIYNQETKEIQKLKNFISTPVQLSVYDKYLYYKKNSVMSNESYLYRLNTKTKYEKKILRQAIDKYMIYDGNIYYTKSNEKQKGLYKCDINGKVETLLISDDILEFVIVDKDIFYINNNQIKHFNTEREEKVTIVHVEKSDRLYDLSYFSNKLYFVSYNLNDTLGDSVYKYEISSQQISNIIKGTPASIRYVDDEKIVFENREGIYQFRFATKSKHLFLENYVVNEMYMFNSEVYFYTTNTNGVNEFWKFNESDSECRKIY